MGKYSYEFNPFEEFDSIEVPKENKEAAQSEIADYIKEQALLMIGKGKSPVQGGPWKKALTPAYKKLKSKESSSNFANLELTGELLDHFDVKTKGREKISVEVSGGKEVVGKAEGNNIGSYGKSANDKHARRFIPLEDETFKKAILDGVKRILKDHTDDGQS